MGADARSAASLFLFALGIVSTLLGILPRENFFGISVSVAILLLIGHPSLALTRRLPVRLFSAYSAAVHTTELAAYTAIIHFSGGIEAAFLTGIYAAMIAYVGVVLPRPWPFRVALGSSVAFALLVALEFSGVLAHRPLEPHAHLPPPIQVVVLGLTISVLFVVADVATQGADTIRHAKERLHEQNQALESATARAIQSDRLKSEFLANMSHEIRTPLNGVIGMTSLLLNAPLHPDHKGQVQTIRASGQALLDIINDVLDLSRVESGVIALDPAPFDVRSCFEDAVTIVSGSAAAKGLRLALTFGDPIPVAVTGDQGRLRQIVVNLLANAVKFTDAGEVSVHVAVVPEGGLFRLEARVEDTGPGIPAAATDRLFRPFVQVDASLTRKFGGTGLGLVISKRLARLMGGDVLYEARRGGGSIFRMTVALRPGEARPKTSDLTATLAHARAALPQVDPTAPPMRILVVDDNAVNQRVATMMLKHLGYEADVAADGVEALEALDRQPYDIILMDVQMPNLDGVEATRKIRARQTALRLPGPLILGVSAHALSTDRDVCLEAGMDGYLTKPFQLMDLETAIARLVGGRKTNEPEGRGDVASTSGS